jgi:RNA polymerase sigma-70 factor, ECF subfamily
MDEKTAISQLQQGLPDGLEYLVKTYQVRAVYTANMIVFDRSLAEDIAQTAFICAAEKIHQFDNDRPFAPWFFRIVINESIKIAKQQKRQVRLEEDSGDEAGEVAKWLIDPQSQPEKSLEFKEMQLDLISALKRLKPEQRAVVVMHYYLEMSELEMSDRMNRPVSTIKWWMRSAREHLLGLIKPSHMVEEKEDNYEQLN